ncbi:MAG TPA: DNA alkylation repair protein [Paludibacteraceae bacterium]|nr:DNA alkylation repair protein [Paludibacteraceae bacterium]HPT43745.1 DNA alkylation repair protein [Paludibacteraceae bacterium]
MAFIYLYIRYMSVLKCRDMEVNEIIAELHKLASEDHYNKLSRFGIPADKAIGVKIPDLRRLAKKIGKNQKTGFSLWKTDIHEARLLASMIMDGRLLTEYEFDGLVNDFDSWDICDCTCSMLQKSLFARNKIDEYADNQNEYVKRTAFVLICYFAVIDKSKSDDFFNPFFKIIEKEAWDDRNFVRKAVNWALRQTGKRNENLRIKAIETANDILKQNTKSARWIAKDAIRELNDEKIIVRIRKKADLL